MSSATNDSPRLTDEQRIALDLRGASVALSAGAGCGKTTVLTERFLAALEGEGPIALASIAAMTFTEKAARELRQRIRKASRFRLTSAKDEDSAYWKQVLRGLAAAPVSTFHEYCGAMLRRHSARAGIDPDFQVLDAPIAASIRDDAIARCIRRRLAEGDNDLIDLAAELGLDRVRAGLEGLVDRRAGGALEAWVERTEREIFDIWRSVWQRDGRAAAAQPLLRSAGEVRDFLAVQYYEHPKLIEMRTKLLAELSSFEHDYLRDGWLEELREQAKLPTGLRREQWPSEEVNEATKSKVKSLRDAIDNWFEMNQWDEAESLRAAGFSLRFARLALEARREYHEAKRDRGGLDFDDMLLAARDLLRRTADVVRHEPGRPVEFVLVDEFQDTDPVQNEILRHLCGVEFADGRLFIVGDFKQSIYRFRGAQPEIFSRLRGELRELHPAVPQPSLTENFRSGPAILNFVNALFAEAFQDNGAPPRLLPGPGAFDLGKGPQVEFVWAEEPAEEADEMRKKPDADGRRQVEARWLARLIRARLDHGWNVRDLETRATRAAHPGDIAFLFRAMTDVKHYEVALANERLDYHVVGGAAFYAQQEIQDVVNVLSVIEDPVDSAALAGALRSPFFALSDVALFWLGARTRGDLAEGLARSEEIAELSPIDRGRAERARSLLAAWRAMKDRSTIAELVDRVLEESGFEAALPGEFLGDRKRANARKLARLARQFDARGGFTLAQFVAKLRADLREPPREEQAATTDEAGQSVRLMSIHQAKGLEFPIVVVPDLNRKGEPSRNGVVFHSMLGPLVRLASEPVEGEDDESTSGEGGALGWKLFQALERVEDDEEAKRLFYVATTRARDALILSAGVGPGAKPGSPALRLLAERFDRATGECRARLPDGWGIPSVRVITTPPASASHAARQRSTRPDLIGVSRLIASTPVQPTAARVDTPRRPRSILIDEARRLSPRAARRDRLLRSILADPDLEGPDTLDALARRAGRRQDPVAHAELIEAVVSSLAPGLSSTLGPALAAAADVERGFEWMLEWPSDSENATVFHGRCEFVIREATGESRVLVIGDPSAPEAWERLRLLLSVRAAASLGLGPVFRAWRMRLGDSAEIETEEDFRDGVIEGAITSALEVRIGS